MQARQVTPPPTTFCILRPPTMPLHLLEHSLRKEEVCLSRSAMGSGNFHQHLGIVLRLTGILEMVPGIYILSTCKRTYISTQISLLYMTGSGFPLVLVYAHNCL